MVENILLILLGLAVGALLGYLAARLAARGEGASLARLEEQVRQLEPCREEALKLREENAGLRTELAEDRAARTHQQEKLQWVEAAEGQLKEAFSVLSTRALQENAEAYLARTREQLDTMRKLMAGDWGQQKEQMSGLFLPLKENLQALDKQVRSIEEKREGAYKSLETHLGQLRGAYEQLRDTTTGLASALTRSSSARGTWGEMQLRRIVEMAGMVEHVDFEEQATGEQGRPDLLVHMPNGGLLPVDAKTTLDSYRALVEASSEETRRDCLQQHARAVRGRVRELGGKAYWKNFARAPEFVVMFLPHDGLLSAAFEAEGDLLEFAFSQKVLLVTPITLLALLKTAAYGWQQQALAENAQRIADEGRELYDRLTKFVKHLTDTGRSLSRTTEAYNKAVGSLESRLMPSGRRLKELGVSSTEIEAPAPVEQEPRLPAAATEEAGEGNAQ